MPTIVAINASQALSAVAKRPCRTGSSPRMRQKALELMADEGLAAPAYCHRTQSVGYIEEAGSELGESLLKAPGLANISAQLQAVAGIVCTLGPAIETRATELCAERKLSLAVALDEVGNELLMYAARSAAVAVRKEARQLGMTVGDSFIPGGHGLPLDQQEKVLNLAGGRRLQVSATPRGMLFPLKSRSMIVGIGAGLSAQSPGKRCAQCTSGEICRYRNC
jgi:hypothetical protein